ncbi:MAG TPA: FtsK/SpoIIIE domain-containing protein [Nocardioidaceae bacterium]|nr:FtsK/SpoIIIE domain-containing protein [Nocardioidaceae bacterium]
MVSQGPAQAKFALRSLDEAVSGLAALRGRLVDGWSASTSAIEGIEATIRRVEAERSRRELVLKDLVRQFGQPTTAASPDPVAATDSRWLVAGMDGARELSEQVGRAFDNDATEARSRFRESFRRRRGGSERRAGELAIARYAARLDGLGKLAGLLHDEIRSAEWERSQRALADRVAADEALTTLVSSVESVRRGLHPTLLPWSDTTWNEWEVTSLVPPATVLAGSLVPLEDPAQGENSRFATDLHLPFYYVHSGNLELRHGAANGETAAGLARAIALRLFACFAPGDLRVDVFDPVGQGQSAGRLLDLTEYSTDLIGGKAWTSPAEISASLAEHAAYVELVLQKYLRGAYRSIAEFNLDAGETAEPYRLLLVFGFPTAFDADAVGQLVRLLRNGPRCGLQTILVSDRSAVHSPQLSGVVRLEDADITTWEIDEPFVEGRRGIDLAMQLWPDADQGSADAERIGRRIIDAVGRGAALRTEAPVTFEKVFDLFRASAARGIKEELVDFMASTDPRASLTWWQGLSTRGLFAPIGQKGARDVAILGFDSSDHAGALLVGRPGSGKSTLLHAYIGGLTTLYGPDELELYLIDFKEGVEFKAYAEEQLPHAKVIAIESDREFGLSVLESLQAEIAQRGDILRATGGRQAGMQGLRETTGEKIPRILLVFDEFQVLFARNDKVGLAAADLLESIIRQGRGFGVHVLLGSQSLAGLDALGAHVPQLLPVRILLPSTEADARKVLGDTNNEGDFLTSRGEGILNGAGGAVEANERFKGALLLEQDRVARLQVMREKANEAGFVRVPMVFEGNSLIPLDNQDPAQFKEELTASGTYPVRVRSGSPMTVGDIGDLVLSREAGANVLNIVRSGENDNTWLEPAGGPAYGLLAAAVASGAMTNSALDVIDFMPNDDGLDTLFEPLLDAKRISLKRRRAFADVLDAYAIEVADRIEQDDTNRPSKVLFLFGVHRARELDAEFGSLDVDTELVEKLEQVMRDGPEVGVHVWIWADSVAGASRRLTARMMRELAWRVAGKMSSDDSQTFVGSGQAADLRESQLLLINDDRGVTTRVTAYAPPSCAWVTQVTAAALSD